MPNASFNTPVQVKKLVDDYFDYIEGEYHETEKPGKDDKTPPTTEKKCIREPEPPTIAGLAHFLGFNTRQMFENYCKEGEFADILSRGSLRIEACYEKKLHNQSATGAIFALKSMGWNEKSETLVTDTEVSKTLRIELVEAGPNVAASEKEVEL
jgi:hypothetical protein